jgi:Na+/proline symporter
LPAAAACVFAGSFFLSPRVRHIDGFFRGVSATGAAPGLSTLVLSQVTTWIFARSLMNAAILGYYYGIAGTLAYAAYYLSFLTGGAIVDSIRFRHGCASIQEFLTQRFGRTGARCFNALVAVRLLSEVFANLLVIGIIFGAAGTTDYYAAIAALAVLTLAYSMMGGLSASLRTDVFQMVLFLALMVVLMAELGASGGLDLGRIAASSPAVDGPGWALLVVAGLQVWSYPMHDPVMMDRGFLADRATTRQSFLHAAWLGVACILAFGLIGVDAGLARTEGEALMATLMRQFDTTTIMVFNLALIVSAVSTLDSTLSSASKLAVVDMGIGRPTIANGRIAMAGFMAGGLVFLFIGSQDLFSAVAVSGTAAMYLTPVVLFTVWAGRPAPAWSYVTSFCAAMLGAALYFLEASGYANVVAPLTGFEHKYSKLLVICVAVLVVGCGAFLIGMTRDRR